MMQSFLSLLRLTKFMLTLELAGSTTRRNVAFPMVNILLRRQLLQNHLILNLALLKWRNILLRQIKNCFDDNFNPAKVNAIDPTKDNFTHPLSIKEILDG